MTRVEFVCSGNRDRSVFGEAFAIKNALGYGVNGVEFSSSGTLVNYYVELPESALINILGNNLAKLVSEGLIDSGEVDIVRSTLDVNNLRGIIDRLGKYSHENRRIVAEEKGVLALGLVMADRRSVQTVPRPEIDLIYAADRENLTRVRHIYSTAGLSPKIELLTRAKGLDIPDPFLVNRETYREIIDLVESAVLEIIDEF